MALHRRCTSVRLSIQHTSTPARDGQPRVRGRLVGRWYQINHAIQVRRFTWATRILCEHTSLMHLTTSTKYTCGLSIGINVLPGFWHIIWTCGLSTSAANSQDFTVFRTSGKSLIYITNNNGPRLLPCGMPLKTANQLENFPLTRTLKCLSLRNAFTHLINLLLTE